MSLAATRPGTLPAPEAYTPQSRRQPLVRGWQLSHPRPLAALAAIVLCLPVWLALAPPQIGGSTSYVITTGTSMLPRYHAGDLVLLRRQSSYRVGEVAGYHNGQLKATVMHRIVAVQDGHYLFKGDNNDFIDSYEPTASQIVGAEWVHLPGWGDLLLALRAPVVGAALLGLMWLWLWWPRSRSRLHRRRRCHAH